jgi:DNA-binding response OmpR family regulator
MRMNAEVQTRRSENRLASPGADGQQSEECFAERRHIVLMESDESLRPVIVRTLLRLGCVVRFKHSLADVVETMREGWPDGAVVALDPDAELAARLQAANRRQAPLVVLIQTAPDPLWSRQMPGVRFLEKPFDVRELCALLKLPLRAPIVPAH